MKNPDLARCYKVVRDNPKELIKSLKEIQTIYYTIEKEEDKKEFFLKEREIYNSNRLSDIDNSTLFIFIVCFGFRAPLCRFTILVFKAKLNGKR